MKHNRLALMGSFAIAALFAVDSAAWAHASLAQSEPQANAKLGSAPKQVQLQFTEALEAKFSGIEVTDLAGKAVTAEKATVDSSTPTALQLSLPTLKPGAYKVRWNAVTRDGHRVKGEYGFTVN